MKELKTELFIERTKKMEEKTNALKTSGKVISIIMKIGYIVTIITMCASAAVLIFMAVTGGKTSITTSGGTKIAIADELSTTPEDLVIFCAELLVISIFLFVIFLLIYRMFHEISMTGDPFTEKYVQTIRIIGVLVAMMTTVTGIISVTATSFTIDGNVGKYTEAPGIAVGIIIFCFSYIIDYGCALKSSKEQ